MTRVTGNIALLYYSISMLCLFFGAVIIHEILIVLKSKVTLQKWVAYASNLQKRI